MEIFVWQQRTKQNLTLVQLADITGVSKSEINAIENGKASPRLDTLERGSRLFIIWSTSRDHTGTRQSRKRKGVHHAAATP